jgi:hypothetical protein
MIREIADPTPALDLVAERVIKPRLDAVTAAVAEILRRGAEQALVKRAC